MTSPYTHYSLTNMSMPHTHRLTPTTCLLLHTCSLSYTQTHSTPARRLRPHTPHHSHLLSLHLSPPHTHTHTHTNTDTLSLSLSHTHTHTHTHSITDTLSLSHTHTDISSSSYPSSTHSHNPPPSLP